MNLKQKLEDLKLKLTPVAYIKTKDSIKNLVKWFPVIWNDRNYDYVFIFIILEFKLEQMEKLQRYHGYSLYSKQYANEINRAIKVLNRLTNQEYGEIAYKFLNKKYGDIKIEYGKKYEDGSFQVHFYREYETENNKEKVKEETLRCFDQEDYLEKQDIEYLFRLMKKHMRKWWD